MTYVFPLRSMLEKWNPVPNPFEIVFAVFVLEKAKLVSKGFGTQPLLFYFGSCWKK
jgi:hypothetical protein